MSMRALRRVVAATAMWTMVAGAGYAQAPPDPTICAGQNFPDFCFINLTLTPGAFGDAGWADFDLDGDLDLAIAYNANTFGAPVVRTRIFANQGDIAFLVPSQDPTRPPATVYQTTYSEVVASVEIPNDQRVWNGALAWTDYNGDARPDLLVSGRNGIGGLLTTLLRGTDTNIQLEPAVDLVGLSAGGADFADYDRDGDVDLVLTGTSFGGEPLTILYDNLGGDAGFVFSATTLEGLAFSDVAWGDYDADGDPDLVLSGMTPDQAGVIRVYENQGAGALVLAAELGGTLFSSVAWGDYDGDGDLDLGVNGGRLSPFVVRGTARVYRNDGGGSFSVAAEMAGGFQGDAAWVDYDNDGDLDFFVSGGTRVAGEIRAQGYRNDAGAFVADQSAFFGGGLFGRMLWGDYEADGDQDLLLFGQSFGGNLLIQKHRNEFAPDAVPPGVPDGLLAVPTGRSVTMSWQRPSDDSTPSLALTYNLAVGSAPGLVDVMAPMAQASGQLTAPHPGNAGSANSVTLSNLPDGVYYWRVQAIDAGLAASAFSAEGSFVITAGGS